MELAFGKFRSFAPLAAVLLAICLTPALANDDTGGEVGVMIGAISVDELMTGETSSTVEPLLGLRGGSVFTPHWGWYVDGLYSEVGTKGSLGDGRTIVGRTGVDYLFTPQRDARWFVTAGAGWIVVDYEKSSSADFHNPLASLGFGQRIVIGQDMHLRWELRGDQTLDDARLTDDLFQAYALVGVTWGPGSSIRYGQPKGRYSDGSNDVDGDGVKNKRDLCPRSPQGSAVDGDGCALDDDGDGVPNGIDQCAGTARAEVVDGRGCPADSDNDGVSDKTDFCASTPSDATVDEWGCPKDSDGDRILDGLDRCPNTPQGANVDGSGCPTDGDGDGVPDGLDRCLGTPAGTAVDATGCPQDG